MIMYSRGDESVFVYETQLTTEIHTHSYNHTSASTNTHRFVTKRKMMEDHHTSNKKKSSDHTNFN